MREHHGRSGPGSSTSAGFKTAGLYIKLRMFYDSNTMVDVPKFIEALVLTVGVETAALFLLVRLAFKLQRDALSDSLLFFCGVLCSSTTLPYLWFVLPHLLNNRGVFVVVGEALVFLAETVIYAFVLRVGVKRSLALSLVCNLASIVAGLILM